MYVLGYKIIIMFVNFKKKKSIKRGIDGYLSILVFVRKCWGVLCLDFKFYFKVLILFGDFFNFNFCFLLFDS